MRLREHEGITAGRIDILNCKPDAIALEDGYNVRDLTTPEAREKLDELKAQIKENGVQTPLKVRFRDDKIILVEGHRRLAAVLELIAEYKAAKGAPDRGRWIEAVPIFPESPGTTVEDRDFALVTSNSGEPLTQLELANLIYRLNTGRGIALETIAQRWGKSLAAIKQTLSMRAMSEPVKEHIRKGDISASLANKISKSADPDKAEELIRANLEENKRIMGTKRRTKVTPKTLKRDAAPKTPKAPEPAKEDAKPAPFIAEVEPEIPTHATVFPHAQLQEAAERERGPALVVTLPEPLPPGFKIVEHPNLRSLVSKDIQSVLGELAKVAEDNELGERDPSETVPVSVELIARADRLYRQIIGEIAA